jgi:hypothetical protein
MVTLLIDVWTPPFCLENLNIAWNNCTHVLYTISFYKCKFFFVKNKKWSSTIDNHSFFKYYLNYSRSTTDKDSIKDLTSSPSIAKPPSFSGILTTISHPHLYPAKK